MARGETEGSRVGHIILPSSHTGSPRQQAQAYQDALAIVRKHGKPDLFITMTCNPKWPEITKHLLGNQTSTNRPDVVARVFQLKARGAAAAAPALALAQVPGDAHSCGTQSLLQRGSVHCAWPRVGPC